MGKVLRRQPLTIEDYLDFDDHDVMFHVKRWVREPDRILSDLASSFLHRRMFKSVDLAMNSEQKRQFIELARKTVESAGLDSRFYLVEDRASDIPYLGPYSPDTAGPENHIYVEDQTTPGAIKEITEVSQVVRHLKRFHIDRLCFPEYLIEPIQELLQPLALSKEEKR
jgi:hypothetical protein